jgi:glycosyltransferase AglE
MITMEKIAKGSKIVSVIIPVYNDPEGIQNILDALVKQTYPKQSYEIIVVDNGSTDSTFAVATAYQQNHPNLIQVMNENSVQSSYAARNKGFLASSGEIIAMVDADCTPIPEWIEKGVDALSKENVDLVGGNVTFQFPASPSAAEVYDSMSNMQMKKNIEERGVAKTANLFVNRSVFERIGNFPDNVKSGGDVIWTSKATRAGLNLVYSDDAKVYHPARRLGALLAKQIRVGQGQPKIWKHYGLSRFEIFKYIVLGLLPRRFSMIKKQINKYPNLINQKPLLCIWLTAWLCNLANSYGRIKALIHSKNTSNNV